MPVRAPDCAQLHYWLARVPGGSPVQPHRRRITGAHTPARWPAMNGQRQSSAAARHLAAARDRDLADLGVKVDANRCAINALGVQTAARFDRPGNTTDSALIRQVKNDM